jgi:MSHA biogenesis protein MshM
MSLQLLTQRIQSRLLELHAMGHSVVLILDEAQALPTESLEALRLFTNLETEKRKLLQVVLFAQPELDSRIATTEFRQLRQRITFSYKLRAMNANEVQQYIHHRLLVAGYRGAELFPSRVCKKIAMVSQGVPRIVNVLCHKILMLAYGQGHYNISGNLLNLAAKDTESVNSSSPTKNITIATLIVIIMGCIFYYAVMVNS